MAYYVESRVHETVSINSRNMNFLPHLHGEVEVVTVLTGSVSLNISGVRYDLQPGDSALVQPDCIHAYQSKTCHCLLTIFDPALIPSLRKAMHANQYAEPVWRGVSEEYLYAVRRLLDCSIARDEPTLIKGYLYVLTTLLLAQLKPCMQQMAGFDAFRRVLQYVNEHFDSPITIQDTARQFGVSYEHLSRVYRERTGLTFTAHVRLLRMDKARRLLQETEMTIYEIALECGYGCERSFYRAFYSVNGVTPRQYRDNIPSRHEKGKMP